MRIVLQILSSHCVSGDLSGIWGSIQPVLESEYLVNNTYILYVTLGETDQIPGNTYLLVCSCFSLFEVMLFTGNSVINSFRSSLGGN